MSQYANIELDDEDIEILNHLYEEDGIGGGRLEVDKTSPYLKNLIAVKAYLALPAEPTS